VENHLLQRGGVRKKKALRGERGGFVREQTTPNGLTIIERGRKEHEQAECEKKTITIKK